MNTITLHNATAVITRTGLRREIVTPVCMSAQSPVFVLHEPPSP